MEKKPVQWLEHIRINGYRCFEDTFFDFKPLMVIAGANGTGKSSLFEFLRFLRDACFYEIPPEIVGGSIGRNIFHKPGPDKFEWWLKTSNWESDIRYYGELMGPIGNPIISSETIDCDDCGQAALNYLQLKNGKGTIREPKTGIMKAWDIKKTNQLGLGAISDPAMTGLYDLREYIRSWRFYNAFKINDEKIKRPVPISQNPLLAEDAGNLSSVLFHLMSEHRDSFEQLKSVIKTAIPGFKNINIKARGGIGEVLAFWMEDCIDSELTLADLSDGTLRFIIWAVLSVMPSAPTLVCIDEPDQGVHPRTLPILAGLFEKASQRTQFILATHASYFLTQFKVENISVMKKDGGNSRYIKISDSKTLLDNLDDFGSEELELIIETL